MDSWNNFWENRKLKKEDKMAADQSSKPSEDNERDRSKKADQALEETIQARKRIEKRNKKIKKEIRNMEKFSRLKKSLEDEKTKEEELQAAIKKTDAAKEEVYPSSKK